MFEFGLFFRLHVGKDIFSAAEVLAADLQRRNWAACEAVKCKDILKTSLQTQEQKLQKISSKLQRKQKNWT